MPQFILGKKMGMTRVYDDHGEEVAVTVVKAGPCVVVQCKTEKTDGYEAVQVGFDDKRRARTNSPMMGHFEIRGISPKKYLREFRVDASDDYEEGQELSVEQFEDGQTVDITGISKGRGFSGVMRRYDFKGGPASHGSKVHRTPQSSGATDPQRVFKGTRKPGHMGDETVTVQNLTVVDADEQQHLLVIKGSVPGNKGGLLVIRGSQ